MTSATTYPSNDLPTRVRGRYVAYTGQLAWLTQEQFQDIVESFGGHFTYRLGRGVYVLVVGEKDLPLGPDGTLTNHLRLARVMERAHTLGALIVSESQFLRRLGVEHEPGAPVDEEDGPRLYTTATLTDLLELPASRIRAWVRAGLITPAKTEHGVWHFDFRQVSAAKTLDHLMRRGVSAGRLRRSLQQLRRWLPEAQQSLEQLTVLERNGELLFRLERGDLAAASGQLHIDFDRRADEDEEDEEASPAPIRLYAGPRTAAEWFEQGVEQEQAGYIAEAAESYRQALQAGGPDALTCFELANVLSALGKQREAIERYLQAVEIDKDFGDAWNNLGITLCAIRRREAGCAAFRRALAANPADTRACYNLADTLDELRRSAEAAEYWRTYLRHDRDSEFAEYAQDRIAAANCW